MGRPAALNHDDTNDREVGKEFLELQGWSGITYGGYWDLDLEVHSFKRGCDVEMNHYNHYTTFKAEGQFRVPARKIRYWNTDGKYGEWKVDYIQFSDNKLEELLGIHTSYLRCIKIITLFWKHSEKKDTMKNSPHLFPFHLKLGANMSRGGKRKKMFGKDLYIPTISCILVL